MYVPGGLLRLPVPLGLGPLLDLLLLADDVAVGQPLADLLERHQVQPVAGGPTLRIKGIPVTKTPTQV